jgi:hypothetical protein
MNSRIFLKESAPGCRVMFETMNSQWSQYYFKAVKPGTAEARLPLAQVGRGHGDAGPASAGGGVGTGGRPDGDSAASAPEQPATVPGEEATAHP